MKKLNSIKNNLSKEDRKASFQYPSKLFTEFFNSILIELDEEYSYDA